MERILWASKECMQVVFMGLDMVIPLMTGELLHFPKLIRAFFSLISYMLEVYPERVAALPGAAPCRPACRGSTHSETAALLQTCN